MFLWSFGLLTSVASEIATPPKPPHGQDGLDRRHAIVGNEDLADHPLALSLLHTRTICEVPNATAVPKAAAGCCPHLRYSAVAAVSSTLASQCRKTSGDKTRAQSAK